MLLAIDVGNTNIVLGIYRDKHLIHQWRISTDRGKSSDEYAQLFKQLLKHNGIDAAHIKAVAVASVVPPLMHSLENAIWKSFKLRALVIRHDLKTGLQNKYDHPEQLGMDRWVNAVAAYHLYGGPVIIVDCGTATKLCAVTAEGDYLGGMICPGIKISADALFRTAAKLQAVDFVKPPTVIGKNTPHAVQSGIIFGFAGMVQYLVKKMKEELAADQVKVVATGGLAWVVADDGGIDIVNEMLTLEGVRILCEMNTDGLH